MTTDSVWRGAAAGALGGALGSTAMVAFNHLLGYAGFAEHDVGRHHQSRRLDAKPNDSDGTISDEPSTRKAAGELSAAVAGQRLDERDKDWAGAIVHHVFGVLTGAIYGAVAARVPAVTAGGGVPYGAFVWVAAAETGLPLVGLARRPTEYPLARHGASLASHFVFGATVEAVRRLATRR